MRWICKFCTYYSGNRKRIIEHYRAIHGHHGRNCPLPCIYSDCPLVFRSQESLNKHLREHGLSHHGPVGGLNLKINCQLCDFNYPVTIKQYFGHLGKHLRNKETVTCPFNHCSHETRNYTTFTSHKSRFHNNATLQDLKSELITQTHLGVELVADQVVSDVSDAECFEDEIVNEQEDTSDKVQARLASLLLRLETVLHVSKTAVQQIVTEFRDIGVLLSEVNKNTLDKALRQNGCTIDENTINLVKDTLCQANHFSCLSEGGSLSTDKRRSSFFKENFSLINPVEYVLDFSSKKTFVYVPILRVLQALLNRGDVIDRVLEENRKSPSGQYKSFFDASYCKENPLVNGEDLSISLGLYIDDFEICNPLGTSRKKHKLCAIYWIIGNLPVRDRSSLSTIYLAALCKSQDIKTFGYGPIVQPLLRDLQLLEKEGIYIDRLGTSVRGTVLYISSDNLGAHSFAGFQESFNVDKFCRFCLASRKDIQTCSVRSGSFVLRTIESHNLNLSELKENTNLKSVNGVKRECVLNELQYFHCITGFPPDFLHDLFEGIVPFELCLCLKKFIDRKYFTLDNLNTAIQYFPYKYSDKTNCPQKISVNFHLSGTIGGNGHENWTLLRLLPLIIGDDVPENDDAWSLILELKDIVEILASSAFTDESICYLEAKIFEHRKLLTDVFPDVKLKPKHHFLEHYPHLIRCFGPVVDFWTFRFEAKHSFFKKAVRDLNNFKNIVLSLANRHQLMLAYHFDMPCLFKPAVEVERTTHNSLENVPLPVKLAIQHKFSHLTTISLATTALIHGTKYVKGMFVSFGSTSGLPDFCQVLYIVIVDNKAFVVLQPFSGCYLDHYRCYEVCSAEDSQLVVVDPAELNHYVPLPAYVVQGRLLISPKAFLLH